MKKRYALLLLTLLTVLALTVTGCGSSNNKTVDESFKEDLMKGLSTRWEITDQHNEDDDYEITEDDYEKYISAEYSLVSKYKDETFEDKELGELAKEYIEVLDRSRDTLEYFSNYEKWDTEWYHVRNDRIDILVDLNKKLKIEFSDKKDKENFDELISEGKVLKSVRELMSTTKFEMTSGEFDWYTYSAVVENTTDENFEYFAFDIKLYDADGVTIETTFAPTDNWDVGEKVRFEFQTDVEFTEMEIVSCDYYY